MKNFVVAITLSLLCASGADAGARTENAVTVQTTVALNGSQAARTSSAIPVRHHSVVKLRYEYVYDSGTALEVHCETSENGTSGWDHLDVPDANGLLVAGLSLYNYTTVSADFGFDVRVGIGSFHFIRCYVTVAAAVAADTISLAYTLYE